MTNEEKKIKELEERIKNLEVIINAIVDYRFPDGNPMCSGGKFTLREKFDDCYASELEEKAYRIIKKLYGGW